jgi:antitoxin CptB
MQELDVMLIPFVENHLQNLPTDLQSAYLRFIDREDWELFDWLQGREQPEDPELKELVARVLAAA